MSCSEECIEAGGDARADLDDVERAVGGSVSGYESIRLKFDLMHQSGVIAVISC